jgi:hypothetical protein
VSAPSRTGILPPSARSSDDDEPVLARTLTRLAAAAPAIDGVWKRDAQRGDWIVARTRNSTYTLAVQEDLTVVASGGWFARQPAGQAHVGVSGCTWGGSAILTGMMAAPGMCIEFSNGVRTTRVYDVQVVRNVEGRPH